MKVAGRADSYLQKTGFAKPANRIFGGTIDDFKPEFFR
jgi:hypothetical protein